MMTPNFNDNALPAWLDTHTEADYDTLPFGVVQMDYNGTITAYNKVLSELAGISREHAIGKNFFIQVAPCTNNFMVAEKYGQDQLDETLPYMFTYITQPTPVVLRLIKHAAGHQYLLAKNN